MATTPLIKMVVTKAFRFGGKPVQIGDTIEAKPKVAHLLTVIKRAELVNDPDAGNPPSNTYATRDMRAAESVSASTPPAATRRYSGRRNLTSPR